MKESASQFIRKGTVFAYRNAWVDEKNYEIYMRRGQRIIDGVRMWVVDVASINAKKERTGTLPALFDMIEREARAIGFGAIYVECVHTPHLRAWLIRRGYSQDDRMGEERNFHYWHKLQ